MNIGRSNGSDDEGSTINLTPLIDVVFQLLIFFMITMTFSLPKAFSTAGVNDSPGLSPAMFDWPERMKILSLPSAGWVWARAAPPRAKRRRQGARPVAASPRPEAAATPGCPRSGTPRAG